MKNLRSDIEEKYKIALKNNDKAGIRTLRLIKSAIKDKDIALRSEDNKDELLDSGIQKLLKNLVKQRNESLEMYEKAGRDNLAKIELEEIKIINEFLPQELNEEEVKKIINDIIKDQNLNSIKDMGKLMQKLKSEYSAQIDMSLAGKIAKEILK
tara:strand:- start:1968 stop:2429 length:462 start_codon:yes stop_codon:yes gene_type:complete